MERTTVFETATLTLARSKAPFIRCREALQTGVLSHSLADGCHRISAGSRTLYYTSGPASVLTTYGQYRRPAPSQAVLPEIKGGSRLAARHPPRRRRLTCNDGEADSEHDGEDDGEPNTSIRPPPSGLLLGVPVRSALVRDDQRDLLTDFDLAFRGVSRVTSHCRTPARSCFIR